MLIVNSKMAAGILFISTAVLMATGSFTIALAVSLSIMGIILLIPAIVEIIYNELRWNRERKP